MKTNLPLLLIVLFGIVLNACSPSKSKSFNEQLAVSSELLEEDNLLDLFLQDFKKALQNDDKEMIADMCQFPIVNTVCHDLEVIETVSAGGKEMILPQSSREKFLSCYDEVFNECIKRKLRYLRLKDLEKKGGGYEIDLQLEYYTPDGMPAGAGTFTLAISEVDGNFFFTGIFCIGACGGDC